MGFQTKVIEVKVVKSRGWVWDLSSLFYLGFCFELSLQVGK